MGRAGAPRAAAAPSLTLARSCAHREETSSRLGLPRPPRPGAARPTRDWGPPAHPSVGGAPTRRGRGHVPPGPPGAPALRKPERGRGAGASRATYPGASGPRWARRLPPPPGRRGDHSCAWYLWTPLSSAWRPPNPGEPKPGQTCYSRFLPLRSGEEWVRRGQAAAPRSPPSRERTGPAAGMGRPASAHWRAQGEGSRREGAPSPRPLALAGPNRASRSSRPGPAA